MFAGTKGVRGGARGGQGLFKWDDVKNDKNKEFYLGHSLHTNDSNAMWYMKKDSAGGAASSAAPSSSSSVSSSSTRVRDEIRQRQREEEEMMMEALGVVPKKARVYGSLSKEEMRSLLDKDAASAASAAPAEAVDRVKGLGFNSLSGTALTGVVDKLPGANVSEPLSKEAEARARLLAEFKPANVKAAPGRQQELSDKELKKLRKKEKKRAKKEKKKEKKREKKAKKAERKKLKQDHRKRRRHDSDSESSSSESSSMDGENVKRRRHDSPSPERKK